MAQTNESVAGASEQISSESAQADATLLTADDLYLFNEGNHFRLYDKLGAHPVVYKERAGIHFAVWAPNAEHVGVMGNFNGWNKESHRLFQRQNSGIWEGFIPHLALGEPYKYHVRSRYRGYRADKTDPFAFFSELAPQTASVIWDLGYEWGDQQWMSTREQRNSLHTAMSIYEMHAGSWMRVPEEDNRPLTWREMAPKLVAYLHQMGFTHVEFLPIMEHPFLRQLGLPVPGLFLTHQPLRHTPGFHVSDRSAASERYRRHTGLGAFPFSLR